MFLKNLLKCCVIAACASLLFACGKPADNTLPPTPLVGFNPQFNVQTVWKTSVGDGSGGYYFRLQPALSQGVIYTASRNGNVEAINAQSGRTLWAMNVGAPITSGVGVGQGQLYVGTGNATVLALAKKNGQINWRTPVNSEVWAAPTVANGLVLVHTIIGSLSALSATSGKRIWRYDEHVPVLILHAASQAQVAGSTVVAGFANGNLLALSLQTGNVQWQQQIAAAQGESIIQQMVDITVDPIVVDGVVYVATYQGQISALSLDNGQLIWTHKISSFAGMTADHSRVYITDADSRVWAFDESTGAVVWRQSALLGRQVTGPAIFGSSIVVADHYGYVHFLAKADGRFVARTMLGDGVLAAPFTDQKTLYVYTMRGDLYALRTAPLTQRKS